MRSLETIGLFALLFGWGWIAWKYFEADYVRLKATGGPEWARIERRTIWSIIVVAIVGTMLTTTAFIWLDGR
jgi:hypothetical protein